LPRPAADVSTLLAQHGRQLFALLVRLTLRYDVAEDLLQELFCKLATSPNFQKAENHLAYAHRTATNLAFDWRRSKKRKTATVGQYESLADAGNSPLMGLIRREELDQVLNHIAVLPSPGREIIILRYLEHESYETIANQLGKTKHQVRALSFKAITRLREELGQNRTRLKTATTPKALHNKSQDCSPQAGYPGVDAPTSH
jgi:RNA polymerase sigma factor (sigma-70 family)